MIDDDRDKQDCYAIYKIKHNAARAEKRKEFHELPTQVNGVWFNDKLRHTTDKQPDECPDMFLRNVARQGEVFRDA